MKLSLAVGLGLFFGIAPIWGLQMITAATLAHLLRLNKAIVIVATNISIWPLNLFIIYAGIAMGHWLLAESPLDLSWREMNYARFAEYFWDGFVGSILLGAIVAALGTAVTYTVARAVRSR